MRSAQKYLPEEYHLGARRNGTVNPIGCARNGRDR
jgi:hypothetical protein